MALLACPAVGFKDCCFSRNGTPLSNSDRNKWDRKYADRTVTDQLVADDWLVQSTQNVQPGRALDFACGLGQNSVWLASQGWNVDAIDISPVGLELANQLSDEQNQVVNWIPADLDELQLPAETYDLILVFRFLDRGRLPKLIQSALKSGGHLVYETFSVGQADRENNHIKNPDFLLQTGELPGLLPLLTAVLHEETRLSDRTVQRLFARK